MTSRNINPADCPPGSTTPGAPACSRMAAARRIWAGCWHLRTGVYRRRLSTEEKCSEESPRQRAVGHSSKMMHANALQSAWPDRAQHQSTGARCSPFDRQSPGRVEADVGRSALTDSASQKSITWRIMRPELRMSSLHACKLPGEIFPTTRDHCFADTATPWVAGQKVNPHKRTVSAAASVDTEVAEQRWESEIPPPPSMVAGC